MNSKGILVVLAVALILGSFIMVSLIGGKSTGKVISEESSIEIKGSDTLLQLVSNMAESYSSENPSTRISVTGGGSGTGIAALINGEINIATASRRIKDKEIIEAQNKGTNPQEFIIARDMLSVIVNEDNLVKELTIEEIGKIFRGEITNWKEIEGKNEEITLYGRQSTSGTYSFFMENVLEGDYSPKMRNLESNNAILESVRQDKTGIGYVGIGYIKDENGNKVEEINIIEVSTGGKYISPLDESNGAYPISRALYQYFAEKPEKNSEEYNFLIFELSEEGQKIVERTGFVKISEEDKFSNSLMIK